MMLLKTGPQGTAGLSRRGSRVVCSAQMPAQPRELAQSRRAALASGVLLVASICAAGDAQAASKKAEEKAAARAALKRGPAKAGAAKSETKKKEQEEDKGASRSDKLASAKSKRKAAVEEKYAKLRAEAAQGGGAVETPPEPTPGVAADTSDAA